VKCGEGTTNSPELSLLKFLPLAYHQAISLPPTWILHLFSQWPSWGAAHFFLQLGCFGLVHTVYIAIKCLLLSIFSFPIGDNIWIYNVFDVRILNS